MKKITPRFLSLILLFFGFVFGVSSLTSISVFATGEDEGTTPPVTSSETIGLPPDADVDIETTPSTPDQETPSDTTSDETSDSDGEESPSDNLKDLDTNTCKEQTGALNWIICPGTGVLANLIDSIYELIKNLLDIKPFSTESSSPIYLIWQVARNATNVLFVILLLIVIYAQLTGLNINNYNIKRILPRLIIAAILVNLSFIICLLALDLSNIIGSSIRGLFDTIQANAIANGTLSDAANVSMSELLAVILNGGVIAGVTISTIGGLGYVFFSLLTVIGAGTVSVIAGFITIAARQAIVALLVMIAPLAFLAYLLPNTERWFEKWKSLLLRMLIFYPMFSALYGGSQLAGWAIITSATDPIGIVLGIGVQIIPLFFAFSLMKMSGTVLNGINASIRKLATPAQRSFNNWALSHAERNRQNYLANAHTPSTHLREFLDSQKRLRETDTANSLKIRENRAIERANLKMAASTGRDAKGNDTWGPANRYTRNAKLAEYYGTRAANAQSVLSTTLSGYGDYFHDYNSQRLVAAHADSFLESSKQNFLAQNQAQSDQEWLLNKFLTAVNEQEDNPYNFNRLVKSASGGIGHLGEASIMGQVIAKSVEIENRRRVEARVIANKFGYEKPLFRAMIFDCARMSDNGFELDADGNIIEDIDYQIKTDANGNPLYQHRSWQQYIGVHKTTGAEITKEEYDNLTDAERDQYRKVRYFEIKNDQGKLVQRVYEDDAGYMKELLRDDIAIGDPIADRYALSIGTGKGEGEEPGILRRYHSTIAGALNDTKYKEHAAEYTAMLISQLNNGYVNDFGQLNIAKLQTVAVATKAGQFLQNDGFVLRRWIDMFGAIQTDEGFAKYFPDQSIENYHDVNKQKLAGLRMITDAQGNHSWEEVSADSATIEEKRNMIKHKIIPKAMKRMIGLMNRDLSPNILENQKDDALVALQDLANVIGELALQNIDPNVSFNQKPNPDPKLDLFNSQNPRSAIKDRIATIQNMLKAYTEENFPDDLDPDDDDDDDNPPIDPPAPDGGGSGGSHPSGGNGGNGGGHNNSGSSNSTPNPSRHTRHQTTRSRSGRAGVKNTIDSLERARQAAADQAARNDLTIVTETIDMFFLNPYSMDDLCESIETYFNDIERLQPFHDLCVSILDKYRYSARPDSKTNAADLSYDEAEEKERLSHMRDEILHLVNISTWPI